MFKSNLITLIALVFSLNLFAQGTFTLESKTLGGNSTTLEEFNGFGCTGENTSPQLSWKNAPEGTKSFAITMYDPDAPTGSGWWHWVVFDIPNDVNELLKNAGNIEEKLTPKEAIQKHYKLWSSWIRRPLSSRKSWHSSISNYNSCT